MNSASEMRFSVEKPSVVSVQKTEMLTIFAVGLLKDQVLPHHKTKTPVLLIVLKGEILFRINSEELMFIESGTYQAPVDVEHEMIGVHDKNIFMVTQEKTQQLHAQ